MAIKQKRQNYGINEFVLRAFDYDNNVIGRFDDQQTGSLALKHHSCPNGGVVRIAKRWRISVSFHGSRSGGVRGQSRESRLPRDSLGMASKQYSRQSRRDHLSVGHTRSPHLT